MTATWKIWNTFSPCNFQNWNDFPSLSYTIISQLKWKIISLMWIFPEHFITRTVLFFKKSSAKSSPACLFASTIDMVATLSARPLPTALSNLTQGIWFWNWIWKTMSKVGLVFKLAISPRKFIFIIINHKLWQKISSLLPSLKWFSIAPQASSMLRTYPKIIEEVV